MRLHEPAGRLARRVGSAVHPDHAAGAARDVEVYFRAEVRGLDNIPAEGPVLLVGQPLRRHADRGHVRVRAGVLRPLRAAAPLPPARARPGLQAAGGARRACRATAPCRRRRRTWARALERDAALLVYPGGDHETYRPSGSPAKIDFAGRTGFVRLAHRARRADRAGRGDRRAGDGAVPRPGPAHRQAAAARQPAAAEGAAGADRRRRSA